MDWIGITRLFSLAKPTYNYLYPFFINKPVPYWMERLNDFFKGEIKIFLATKIEPHIICEGKLDLPNNIKKRSLEISRELSENEQQTILTEMPDWNSNQIQFNVKSLNYATLLAIREQALLNKTDFPKVLSANTLIICKEDKEIILQRRGPAPYVKTYPNCLGTFGGGYDPEDGKDSNSLVLTAIREVWEEIRLFWMLPHSTFIISEELTTGYIQISFLGGNIPKEAKGYINPRIKEGTPVFVSFDKLGNLLKLQAERIQNISSNELGWLPIGKAHVLAWLAHGAPGAGRNVRFGGMNAYELFNSIVP